MPDLPADWATLCLLIFLLGLRHGFDADHLAAIDGFTRLALRNGQAPAHARWCGALFCLGHGAVVVAMAAAVGLLSTRWAPPAWVDGFGSAVSIGFLLLLGMANLLAVLNAQPGQMVSLVGMKGPWLARLAPAGKPLGIAAVGALFALSFDTLSQTALFALAGARFGGLGHSLLLAALFVLGMLLADGVNGWWIARLLARADQLAARASRVMGLAVAGVSLLVAALGLARWLSPRLDGWVGDRSLAFGAVVLAVLGGSYLVAHIVAHTLTRARRTAQRRHCATATSP